MNCIKICKHCRTDISHMSPRIGANHVRWCADKRTDTKKYSVICTCVVCKKQMSTAIVSRHWESKHCQKYTNVCIACGSGTNNPTFCTRSCAAKHNNAKYPKKKKGCKERKRINIMPPHTKVSQCEACSKYHSRYAKSCSDKCKRKLLSMSVNKRIDNGWNPQEHRNKSTPSYLENSFTMWLDSANYTNYVKNKTFRCGPKIYYGDFYFPELSLLIELDGKQHKDNIKYDMMRDENILKYHNVYTYRISYNEFVAKTKIDIVITMLLEP